MLNVQAEVLDPEYSSVPHTRNSLVNFWSGVFLVKEENKVQIREKFLIRKPRILLDLLCIIV